MSCEKCEKEVKELNENPAGGCVTCAHRTMFNLPGPWRTPCKECLEEATTTRHFPRWESTV